jgi:sulfite exporter TauE/SafE
VSALTLFAAGLTTGLLAGGASCALMHGGLLAAAVGGGRRACALTSERAPVPPRAAVAPSAAFLGGKLFSHVLAGALLGAVGAAAQPGPQVRAVLLVAAAVLMVVAALSMLGVRPLARLGLRAPARRTTPAAGPTTTLRAPAVLGFLTVFVPCGVTLSVALLAMQSTSPVAGAAAMGGFVLGTAPVLAGVGYLVSRSAMRGRLPAVAGALVLVVAVWTLGSGLRLGGWLPESNGFAVPASAAAAVAELPDGTQSVTLRVTSNAFTPSVVALRPGVPTQLVLTTRQTRGCTRMFVLGRLDIQQALPETGTTVLALGVLRPGLLRYTCGIGLHSGRFVVQEPGS